MHQGDIPMLSGLYFTKSLPAEPLIYRGRGNSYYKKWKFGDKVEITDDQLDKEAYQIEEKI
jgi:hypothetical protein